MKSDQNTSFERLSGLRGDGAVGVGVVLSEKGVARRSSEGLFNSASVKSTIDKVAAIQIVGRPKK